MHLVLVCFNNAPKHTFCLPGIKVQRQCVQSGLSEFVFLICKLDYHPLNEMVIKPLFYILCLSLVLARQLSISGGYLKSLNT